MWLNTILINEKIHLCNEDGTQLVHFYYITAEKVIGNIYMDIGGISHIDSDPMVRVRKLESVPRMSS